MKNDANIRNFIEISGNSYGKSGKMRGKSGKFSGISVEFQWNPFHQAEETMGVPVAIRGRFRSFSVVFPVISGHSRSFFRLIPIDSGKSFRFIPFHSFSFHFVPHSAPKPRKIARNPNL